MVENTGLRHEKFLACISSHEKTPRHIIRKVARLATRYNTRFAVLYVQTSRENPDRIPLANQRYLINHFQLATELGAQVIQEQSDDVIGTIVKVARRDQYTTVCIGKPAFRLLTLFRTMWYYRKLINSLFRLNIDLLILS